MPTLEFISKLRAAADSSVLILTARHRLQAYDSFDTIFISKKTRLSDEIHVLPAPNIVLAISGVLDRVPVSPEVLTESQLAQHLLAYLRSNAGQLGLRTISDFYTDDEDDRPKINLTSTRCRQPFHTQVPLSVTLREIHLQYSWSRTKSNPEVESLENHLFSKTLSIPFQSLVDNILGRFVAWHLVKRYPLVFGAWSQQLDTEVRFFSSIYRSIAEMAKRSPNATFRSSVRNLIKTMKHQHAACFEKSSSLLSNCLDVQDECDSHIKNLDISGEIALCLSMEKLFLDGMKRPTFKSSTEIPMTKSDIEDDDELSHDQFLLTSKHPATQTTETSFGDGVIAARPSSPFLFGSVPSNPFDFGDLKLRPGQAHIGIEDDDFDFDMSYHSTGPADIEVFSDDDSLRTQGQTESLPSPQIVDMQHYATLDLDMNSEDSDCLEQNLVIASQLSPSESPTMLAGPHDLYIPAHTHSYEDVALTSCESDLDLDLDTDIESRGDLNMQVPSLNSTHDRRSTPISAAEGQNEILVDSDAESDLSVSSKLHWFRSSQRSLAMNNHLSALVPLCDQYEVDSIEAPGFNMLSESDTDLEIEMNDVGEWLAPELKMAQSKKATLEDEDEIEAFDELVDFCEEGYALQDTDSDLGINIAHFDRQVEARILGHVAFEEEVDWEEDT